jgi:23S rRNA pseudouridine1911/1915/1917 synthase
MVVEVVINNPISPQVLYEDNHLIAVFKPHGMLTQGDETGDESLFDWTKKYLKVTYQKPGNVFLGLLHRLDRPVAGIVLFAKTSKGAARLSEQIREHQVQKIYHARVAGVMPKQSGVLINYLSKDETRNKVAVYDKPAVGAFYAELSYATLEQGAGTSLVEITLKTGRPHQIRAQFAHAGHPLVGDSKYGSTISYATGAIALCAQQLSFALPTKDEVVTIVLKNNPSVDKKSFSV